MAVLNPPPSYTVTVSTASYFSTGSITIPSNYVLSSNGNGSGMWTTNVTSSPTQATLDVSGNADIKGKLTVQGKDIGKILETIEKRMAILVPDPKKLEKFEALRKAYDHYKLLEALCHEEDDGK